MERAKGIEPSCAAWKAAVLPLNYARGDTAQTQDLRKAQDRRNGTRGRCQPAAGPEPETSKPKRLGLARQRESQQAPEWVLRGALVDKDGGERGIRTPEG